MQLIGVVGGVASGKSAVAEQLRQLGATVLDADRIGHDVLRLPEVAHELEQRWGRQVFDSDNQIDRAAVARIVFSRQLGAEQELAALEQITHPRIAHLIQSKVDTLAAKGVRHVVLDAAVMMKAGWDKLCDRIVYVDVPRELRLARAQKRGWSEEEFDRREGAQKSLNVKRDRADVVINNSDSLESTRAQLERFLRTSVG